MISEYFILQNKSSFRLKNVTNLKMNNFKKTLNTTYSKLCMASAFDTKVFTLERKAEPNDLT